MFATAASNWIGTHTVCVLPPATVKLRLGYALLPAIGNSPAYRAAGWPVDL